MIKKFALTVALIVLILEIGVLVYDDMIGYPTALRKLRDNIQADLPGLDEMDNTQKAIAIREHIYTNTLLTPTPDGYDFLEFDQAYQDAISGQVGHICGGLAHIYIAALESQGIPARYVGIFAKSPDNHASVEFWNGEQWIASDPTFNIMFRSEGEYLSWGEIWRVVRGGNMPEFVGNQEARNIKAYYITFDQLVYNAVIHPATIDGKKWPMELYPDNWIEGPTLTPYTGTYEVLGRGLLR